MWGKIHKNEVGSENLCGMDVAGDCYDVLLFIIWPAKNIFPEVWGVLLRRWGDLLGLFQSLNAVQLMYCACTVVMHPVGHKRELQLNEKSAQRRRKH